MSIFEKLRAGIATVSADETRRLGAEFAVALPPDTTLALHGGLGAGKTTFVQGLARGFGIAEPVTSPTFTIFTLHRGFTRTLVHLDAYRIDHPGQIEALMLDDFLVSPWCLAVEWPEKLDGWLPAGAFHLALDIEGDGKHSLRLG